VLVLDAGFSLREIDRRAERVGLDLAGLVGVALTHEHGDHAAGAVRLAARHGVPVLASPGTWGALQAGDAVPFLPIAQGAHTELAAFTLSGCPIPHDAAEPLALAVTARDGTSVGLAYDLGRPTTAVRYLLRNLSAVILEANHDEVLLRTSEYPASVQERIAGSAGHLSNRTAAELLAELHHRGLGAVLLAHLSRRCNTEAAARATVEQALRAVGFTGDVLVARQEEPIGPVTLAHATGAQFTLTL
jgi:phosphoribosyl 1,2-cyclic phosphodiesterase